MDATLATALRFGDSAMVLGQRLGDWVSNSPTVELDVAFGNLALDLIGQANMFYELAGAREGKGRSADNLAFWRNAEEFYNFQITEQPNGDFARTMVRQFLFASFVDLVFEQMKNGSDKDLAAIAEKAQKEMAYHVRHGGEWVIRLGDGTDESHRRAQEAVDFLWPWTHEFFAYDAADDEMVAAGVLPDRETVKTKWLESVNAVFERAGLTINDDGWMPDGSRKGVHSEHLSYLLQEMQVLPRTHPGAQW